MLNIWKRILGGREQILEMLQMLRMHNKFIIIDHDMVITGSPNFTLAAHNYNVESMVVIKHFFVARIYFCYYKYIVSVARGSDRWNSNLIPYQRVKTAAEAFNKCLHGIQLYLAPMVNIKESIQQVLKTSDIVNISMFLVSHADPETEDIVSTLQDLLFEGAVVTLTMDFEMHETDYGGNVFTVSKKSELFVTEGKKIIETIPSIHDKLLLIQYRNGSKRVVLGSAGFSTNVQNNLNLENMISIQNDEIYHFHTHFTQVVNGIAGLTVRRINVKRNNVASES